MSGSTSSQIFTIGHSDHSIERFIELLRAHKISCVADVRSSPFSRFHTQFNKDELHAALKAARIAYVPLGDELGARRSEAECYVDGKARYELIAKTAMFQKGLQRLHQGAIEHRIALMCAERDPITCHRAILVCRHLKALGIATSHILPTGELESNNRMEQRLLDATSDDSAALFVADPVAVIEHAYDVQGERIAYNQRTSVSEERG